MENIRVWYGYVWCSCRSQNPPVWFLIFSRDRNWFDLIFMYRAYTYILSADRDTTPFCWALEVSHMVTGWLERYYKQPTHAYALG